MSNPSFPDDLEKIKNRIDHVQEKLQATRDNLDLLELEIVKQGRGNATFLFLQANLLRDLKTYESQLQDLEAQQTKLVGSQSIQTSVTLLDTHLPTSVFEFYKPQITPLVQFKVVNPTDHPIEFILQSEIEVYSDLREERKSVPPHSEKTFPQLPLLKLDKLKKLRGPTRATVHTHIKEIMHEAEYPDRPEDFEIEFMPRNEIRWAVPDAANNATYIPLLEHIAAWVTPDTDEIGKTLRMAADYNHLSFDGYSQKPDPAFVRNQVKAIYLALKEKVSLAFVPSPFTIGSHNSNIRQIIRLPDETLKARSGNCIDRTVLYASLIEAATLEPMIVLLADHAFVGWKIHASTDTYEFLETTMAANASFEEVSLRGMARYQRLVEKKWFTRPDFDANGFAHLLDIKMLHKEGIYRRE